MKEYHKIQTVYLRNPETKYRTLLEGQFAKPEFDYLKDLEWIWTEKVDGTNIRVELFGSEVSFAGRTDAAQIDPRLLRYLSLTFTADLLRSIFPAGERDPVIGADGIPVILYGEGYGAKIQKGGGNYLPDRCGFILFDVRVGPWWLTREACVEIAEKLAIPIVPELRRGPLLDAVALVRHGLPSAVAEGRCAAEGLVMKPAVELCGRDGKRIIAKIKSKDFRV